MKKASIKRSPIKRKPQDLRRMLFTRFMLIVAVLLLWIGGISVRLVHLQITQHAFLKSRALSQRLNVKRTKLPRGTIYDRNGRVLAMSIPVKTLYADPTEIDNVELAAKRISKIDGLKIPQLSAKLNEAKSSGKRYFPLAKKLDKQAFKRINKELFDPEIKKADEPKFKGIHWEDDQQRSYPNRSLASQTIGFANADDEGMAGIEQSQNDVLEGAIIKKLEKRDRLGRVYDETVIEREPPQNVVLTIDQSVQFLAEEALAQGVAAANARAGMAIVLDPRTGEVLAMANAPSFNPDNLRAGIANSANNAVQSVYSPGSIFKIVTYGSALEKKLFKPTDEIDAGNGTIDVAGHKFTDSHQVGRVSFAEALAHSSNVCAIKTGLRVGKSDFHSMVRKMGFGSKTGIELPAETGGIVRPPDRWNGDSLASMSIGYEIGVTPLQIASAFATIANDGVRVQPHIIKEIRDPEGNTISVTETRQYQVVSWETARDLRTMLRQVVLTGTGKRAQLDGFTSAGKTGTAWKFDPKTKRVERNKYMSSFVGFAPAEDPRYVIAVVIDEPRSGARDGGGVAAPIFRAIAQQLLTGTEMPGIVALPDPEKTLPTASMETNQPTVAERLALAGTKDRKTVESPRGLQSKKRNGDSNSGTTISPPKDPTVSNSNSDIWKMKPKT
jgi:cell division protein FtsI/penicillin-binding protein 2